MKCLCFLKFLLFIFLPFFYCHRVFRIVELEGDGISAEVTHAALSLLPIIEEASNQSLSFEIKQLPIGGRSISSLGTPLSDDVLSQCLNSDAVLLGAVGDPTYDHLELSDRPEAGLLRIRREMGLHVNVRPVKVFSQVSVFPTFEFTIEGEQEQILVKKELESILFICE